MNVPYTVRLLCLCLEMLFLINAVASVVVLGLSRGLSRALTKRAIRVRPETAATWFFSLRLLPFVLSCAVIATLCIPLYLRYEQNLGNEALGILSLATAVMGFALVITSAIRAALALARHHQTLREIKDLHTSRMADFEVYVTEHTMNVPWLALVGILRPRLLVASQLLRSLTAPQLEAALRHERGHQLAHDNLKRLLMALTPDILPAFFRFRTGLDSIERHWEQFAELAADDDAAEGCLDRSIALAETLIKVAQLGNFQPPMPLASSLSANDHELAQRVERLLSDPSSSGVAFPSKTLRMKYPIFLGAAFLLAVLLPGISFPIYQLFESLLH